MLKLGILLPFGRAWYTVDASLHEGSPTDYRISVGLSLSCKFQDHQLILINANILYVHVHACLVLVTLFIALFFAFIDPTAEQQEEKAC